MDFLKTDSIMEIKINVEIGLTPRLENVLAAILAPGAPQAAQGAPSAQVVEEPQAGAPQAAMVAPSAPIVEEPQAAPTELRSSAGPEAGAPQAAQGAPSAQVVEAPQAAPTELTSSAEPEVAAEPEAAEVAAVAEPAEPKVAAEPEAKEAELPAPTDQELRTFMDVTIARFAGVDWQESKDPKVIKIRRSCTRCFKGIAAHLGAEKPTGLVGREKRVQFIAELDRMLIEAGGTEVSWYPF